jgi:cyclohexanecarboxylate-CoA ligase
MTELKTIRDRYSADQIAAYYRAGFWEESSFGQVIASQAADRPDQVFIFDSTTSLTYSQFHEASIRLAAGLKRLGVQRGERVAVQLPNWTEFAVISAAVSRLGAIVVPIMPIYRDDEVGYVLGHSGAVAAITCGEFRGFDHLKMFQALAADIEAVRDVFVVRPAAEYSGPAKDLRDLFVDGELGTLADELGPDSSPDDGFLIVYTSGTTSRPKGCFHTFNTMRASVHGIRAGLAYTEDDVQFGPSPITHTTGLITSVLLPLMSGAKSHLMEAWEPEDGLRRIQEHGCTVVVSATPFLQMLMAAYDADKHDVSSMRIWVCAGSPIPGAIVEKSRDLLGFQTLSLYGRSENMVTTMCTVTDDPSKSASSDGRALPGAEVALVGADGRPVTASEEGDIAYRGPSHMIEYFGDDEQTALLFTPDGFSLSGDLGRMDVDGFVRVTGRTKDIIIRGGMNISAREVEDHLMSHPAVASVAVVGYPDERLGEKVCAYVVLKPDAPGLTLAAVTEHLKEHKVAVQKLPERIELVAALPMTATGKVQKHVLRAELRNKVD